MSSSKSKRPIVVVDGHYYRPTEMECDQYWGEIDQSGRYEPFLAHWTLKMSCTGEKQCFFSGTGSIASEHRPSKRMVHRFSTT